jgi:hypothetical protein
MSASSSEPVRFEDFDLLDIWSARECFETICFNSSRLSAFYFEGFKQIEYKPQAFFMIERLFTRGSGNQVQSSEVQMSTNISMSSRNKK